MPWQPERERRQRLADGVIGLVGTVQAVRTHGHWGALLADGHGYFLSAWWIATFPGAGGGVFNSVVTVPPRGVRG